MQFLHPEVFYMLLIPLVLLIVLILTNNNNMKQYFSKDMIDKLSVSNGTIGKTSRNVMFFTTIILFIVALGRPVVNQKDQELKQQLIPIVIALDVSKSMMATDIYPNRISLAKLKLKEIIKLASNSTIGVVLFAKDSFILSPVTEDFISLNYIVDNLDTNLNFNNGSNIYATLEATAHMLEEFKVKNLIILSDGGNNNEYTDELEFVKEKNIEIYSIGLATKDGSPIPNDNGGYITDNNGNIVTVKLNSSIKNLSLKSGGGYIDFSLDNSDVEAIINRINIQSKKEELNSTKVRTYTELFYYPLGFAVLILFLSFISLPTLKNSSNIVVVFILISLYQDKGYADFFEFETIEKANQLYQDKNYKDALKEYEKLKPSNQSIYNKANSLYKDGKYKEAEKLYNKIDTQDKELNAKKFHNLGNNFVK
ncbi:MAG: VWA domain-containing protein, partial [Campylobacterota bacterium]|nr:VWA domain-containing protein [Campylobacterota bacterium]